MVNESGQLYTIEGLAAAALIIFTAYLVVSTTNLYTQGDTHIPDMQLEQLGNDVLRVMDTSVIENAPSELERIVQTNNGSEFKKTFGAYANRTTDGRTDNLMVNAIIYRSDNTSTTLYTADPYYRENSVKVTRFVHTTGTPNQTVLLEVLVWRQ